MIIRHRGYLVVNQNKEYDSLVINTHYTNNRYGKNEIVNIVPT